MTDRRKSAALALASIIDHGAAPCMNHHVGSITYAPTHVAVRT